MSETRTYRYIETVMPNGGVEFSYDPPLDIPARTTVNIEHFSDGSALITFTPINDPITRVLLRQVMKPWEIAVWFIVFLLVLAFLFLVH